MADDGVCPEPSHQTALLLADCCVGANHPSWSRGVSDTGTVSSSHSQPPAAAGMVSARLLEGHGAFNS